MDDGRTEITPVYVMTHNERQFSTFVRANFYFYNDQKQVKLHAGASIKVNGVELQHDQKTFGLLHWRHAHGAWSVDFRISANSWQGD